MGKLIYWLSYILGNIYLRLIHRIKIKGKNNIPQKGPIIVVSNHVNYLDPPIIGCVIDRQIHFMAKKELFKNKILRYFLLKMGTFPVKRGIPDKGAIRKSLQILKDEQVLGMFPEGTRVKGDKLGDAKPGVILIALMSESPILPVGIKHSDKDNPLRVSIGKPFLLDDYYDRKLSREEKSEIGEVIMSKIKNEIDSLN